MTDFFYYSGIVFWVLIATYVLIVVRLWWIKAKHEVNEFDRECDEFIESMHTLVRQAMQEKVDKELKDG